ncbi:kynurenine--oxoglutarate transaminase 3-like isoform X1 [Strongylocentrotus purpuratus]|uniref:Aminotransferase class I/classII large domain-containing protein n=2 Tax=Strongylocentrotus purpuratus TaxID=7668 RepID=A0A7M7PP33_STRPU|nr:kynurenine--oxoglutarate transaminase 3-like isoform X1 [Strongylocentrotus purpuratus]
MPRLTSLKSLYRLSSRSSSFLPAANVIPSSSFQWGQRHTRSVETMASSKLKAAEHLKGLEGSVWVEFVKLTTEEKAINLGQGFPDFAPPNSVTQALTEILAPGSNPLMNQYTRSYGHARLVNAIAAMYSKFIGREVDPMTGVLVSVGAYGSLYYAINSHVNPGDEVIIIEPFFDCYEPMVRMARGVPRFIPLRPKNEGVTSTRDFYLDKEELKGLFNKKTKAIIVNNPNNPLGKIFSEEELTVIADLCKEHDVMCISDEVYEHLVYSGNKFTRMASLPGMWDRTITVCSAGKIFSATGWKLGWSIGPQHLIKNSQTLHQNCVYNCPTLIQEAVARGLELEFSRLGQPECYFLELPRELEEKRNKMEKVLKESSFIPIIPEGGYFMMAKYGHLGVDVSAYGDGPQDYKMVRYLTKTQGVATIPCSAFYSAEHKSLGEPYIRFCFIKEDCTIDKAAEKLKAFSKSLKA